MTAQPVLDTFEQFRCPTCDGYIPNNDRPGAHRGALSRRDSKTEICSACGHREAMEDYAAARGEGVPATTSVATNQCKAGEGHLVIHPNGETEFITQVELGVDGRQAIIGGRFDCVYLKPGLDMWIHDEGLFLCPLNPVASMLYTLMTGRCELAAVMGTVVLSGVDDEGASLPLSADTASSLRMLVGDLVELAEEAALFTTPCVCCDEPVTYPVHIDEGPRRIYCDTCAGCDKVSVDQRCDACYAAEEETQ